MLSRQSQILIRALGFVFLVVGTLQASVITSPYSNFPRSSLYENTQQADVVVRSQTVRGNKVEARLDRQLITSPEKIKNLKDDSKLHPVVDETQPKKMDAPADKKKVSVRSQTKQDESTASLPRRILGKTLRPDTGKFSSDPVTSSMKKDEKKVGERLVKSNKASAVEKERLTPSQKREQAKGKVNPKADVTGEPGEKKEKDSSTRPKQSLQKSKNTKSAVSSGDEDENELEEAATSKNDVEEGVDQADEEQETDPEQEISSDEGNDQRDDGGDTQSEDDASDAGGANSEDDGSDKGDDAEETASEGDESTQDNEPEEIEKDRSGESNPFRKKSQLSSFISANPVEGQNVLGKTVQDIFGGMFKNDGDEGDQPGQFAPPSKRSESVTSGPRAKEPAPTEVKKALKKTLVKEDKPQPKGPLTKKLAKFLNEDDEDEESESDKQSEDDEESKSEDQEADEDQADSNDEEEPEEEAQEDDMQDNEEEGNQPDESPELDDEAQDDQELQDDDFNVSDDGGEDLNPNDELQDEDFQEGETPQEDQEDESDSDELEQEENLEDVGQYKSGISKSRESAEEKNLVSDDTSMLDEVVDAYPDEGLPYLIEVDGVLQREVAAPGTELYDMLASAGNLSGLPYMFRKEDDSLERRLALPGSAIYEMIQGQPLLNGLPYFALGEDGALTRHIALKNSDIYEKLLKVRQWPVLHYMKKLPDGTYARHAAFKGSELYQKLEKGEQGKPYLVQDKSGALRRHVAYPDNPLYNKLRNPTKGLPYIDDATHKRRLALFGTPLYDLLKATPQGKAYLKKQGDTLSRHMAFPGSSTYVLLNQKVEGLPYLYRSSDNTLTRRVAMPGTSLYNMLQSR